MEHESVVVRDPGMIPEAVPVLPVRDLSEGIKFYLKLGFTIEAESGKQALLSRGSCMLGLNTEGRPAAENSDEAFFPVDCANAFQQELAAFEIAVSKQSGDRPWRMREVAIVDPDGNRLRFAEKFLDGVYS